MDEKLKQAIEALGDLYDSIDHTSPLGTYIGDIMILLADERSEYDLEMAPEWSVRV